MYYLNACFTKNIGIIHKFSTMSFDGKYVYSCENIASQMRLNKVYRQSEISDTFRF